MGMSRANAIVWCLCRWLDKKQAKISLPKTIEEARATGEDESKREKKKKRNESGKSVIRRSL